MNLVNVDAVIDDMTTQVSSHSQPTASSTQPQSQEPLPLQTQSQIRRGNDRLDLTPFLDPTVPGPLSVPPPLDESGWNSIDKWGV